MKDEDPFLAVLREHFPDREIKDHESLITNEFIDDKTRLNVADGKEQAKALKDIERHLRAAQAAYQMLHPAVRRELESQFRANSLERLQFAPGSTLVTEHDLTKPGAKPGAKPEAKRVAKRGTHLSNILSATLYSLTGRPPYTRPPVDYLRDQPSALADALEKARSLLPLTGAAEAKGTWSKVQLVRHAMRCWQIYGSGKPKLYSNDFQGFLQDLANALGRKEQRGWDAMELVKTYDGYGKKLKSSNKSAKIP